MTPAKFGYKIVFSRNGEIQPPIYAYFPDFVERDEIARVVWRHAESLLRDEGNVPDRNLNNATSEARLNSSGYRIVSYKRVSTDQEDGPIT